jgi:Domain of Unknown Function (DUF1259)
MKVGLAIVSLLFLVSPALLAAQTLTTSKIDDALGRSGQASGDVYRVGFPRTDLHVTVDGTAIRPGFALGSWAAFSGTDANAMVMGDLVLLEDELNPVIKSLRSAGFEITAVHNHLKGETPHVLYVHYMGQGEISQIAKSLRAALTTSKTPLDKPAAAQPQSEPAAFSKIEEILSAKGRFAGGVLSFGIPRADPITDHGMPLAPAQGVAEAINFQEFGADQVATTGDFVLIASEVNPVISALRDHNIQITALHSHMLTEEPRLFFMHFWSVGSTDSVAMGIKAALAQVHTK